MSFYLTVTNRADEVIDTQTFASEQELFRYLDEDSVTYYFERGYTELADGRTFEYGPA
jgi:hypothetical protein